MRYDIYIEDYVLSYLKRETDSMELSELFFYGIREEEKKRLFIYGAGRDREIAAFAEYELLEMLMCRLTQAGPVFMVRGENGDYEAGSFQVFYTDNEAMQKYLLDWQQDRMSEKRNARILPEEGKQHRSGLEITEEQIDKKNASFPETFEEMSEKGRHSAISMQLCLVLVVLTAIVIGSANSYDKMEQLGQSAKEVFFAIENQEAEEVENSEAESKLKDGQASGSKKGTETETVQHGTEIVVRKSATSKNEDNSDTALIQSGVEAENAAGAEASQAESKSEEEPEEETSEEVQSSTENGVQKEEPPQEDGEEALSRSITRYYEVEKGDTLYTISQKIYGDTSRVQKICEMNEIEDPDKIRYGEKIILP